MRIISTALSVSILVAIAACGGSSGGTPTPTPSPSPTPTPPPAPIPTDAYKYGGVINVIDGALLAEIDSTTNGLYYAPYVNDGQDTAVHILPDFSYAGYMGGGVALPRYDSIPVRQTLTPQAGDDHARIQAAIDSVGALTPDARGIRGAVLLTAGLYEVSDELFLSDSGVILRGDGQGVNGTIIRAITTDEDAILIRVEGAGSGRFPRAATNRAQTDISQSYAPVGSISVQLADAAGYSIGDHIAIVRTPNEAWIGSGGMDMAQYGWAADDYAIAYERNVTGIDGNVISFDASMVDTIETGFGGGYVYRLDTSDRVRQVGVENLRLETLDYTDISRMDRAFTAINFDEVENSWVRDVTTRYFSHGYNFRDGSRYNTMQDIAFIDPDFEVVGGNHYAFDFKDAGQNVFQRCYSREGRHSFTSGSRATGANVFLDCLAEDSTNDSGPHHRWATGTLFDNTKDELIRVQNRTESGTGHGWAGAQQLIWNGEYDEIVLQTPPFAMNWMVGTSGTLIDGSFSPDEREGIIQSTSGAVIPRSLYLQQIQDRLGSDAVEAITVPAQRQGRIWDALNAWAGEGRFGE